MLILALLEDLTREMSSEFRRHFPVTLEEARSAQSLIGARRVLQPRVQLPTGCLLDSSTQLFEYQLVSTAPRSAIVDVFLKQLLIV